MVHCKGGNVTIGEGIRDVIPKSVQRYKKRARYVSKHTNKVRIDTGQAKSKHRTLGVPKVFLSPPSQYLKKRSRAEPCTKVKHVHPRRFEFRTELPPRIPVAKIIHDPLTTLPRDPIVVGRINFRKRNVTDVKTLKPPALQPKYVDTRFGDRHNLSSSGLIPVYIYKKDYGKVPKGRKPIRRAIGTEEDYNTRYGIDISGKERRKGLRASCHPLSADERLKLLDGMKKKWNETMKQFRCLPFITDTLPKAEKKTRMERELEALEKDIAFLEYHPHIYIYDKIDDYENNDEKISSDRKL